MDEDINRRWERVLVAQSELATDAGIAQSANYKAQLVSLALLCQRRRVMPTSDETVDLLIWFHQASMANRFARTHQQEEVWDNILDQRTRKLLRTILGREPTDDEVDDVLNPPYPEELNET